MTRTVKLFTGHLRCWQAAATVLHTSSSVYVYETNRERGAEIQTDEKER